MIPDPQSRQPTEPEIGGLAAAPSLRCTQVVSVEYPQPISHKSIIAAERALSLLDRTREIFSDRLNSQLCYTASEPLNERGELRRLIVGQDSTGVAVVLQRLEAVQFIRGRENIETFDVRQSELRNLRDVHSFNLAEANQRDARSDKFVQSSSVDLDGRAFRTQIGAITDAISPWSEISIVLNQVCPDHLKLTVRRADPHKTVSPQSVELEFVDKQPQPCRVSFGGEALSNQTRAYRPQLELLCERELPALCDWVESVLLRDSPWVDVAMPFSDFLTNAQ